MRGCALDAGCGPKLLIARAGVVWVIFKGVFVSLLDDVRLRVVRQLPLFAAGAFFSPLFCAILFAARF